MKKLLLLSVGTVLFLSACGDKPAIEEKNSNPPEQMNDDSQTEEVEETNNEELIIDTKKKLGLETEDIFKAKLFEDQEDTLQSFEYENMKIDVVDSDPFRMYVYYIDGSDYASGIVLRNSGKNRELSQETFDFFYNKLDEGIQEASRQFKRADNDYYLNGLIFNGEIDIDNPPMDISEISGEDFFLNEDNVEFYKDALNKAEYKEIYENVISYLNDNDVHGNDSAYQIKEIIEPIHDNLDKVEVHYDDFDNVSTMYYQGMTDINGDNYFIPYVSSENTDMSLLVGFEKEGWLFADKLYFNIDGDKEYFGSFDPDRDVLDKTLSNESLEALKTIYSLRNIRSDLNSVLINFQK